MAYINLTLVIKVSVVYKVVAGNATGNAETPAAANQRRHANETAVKAQIAEILDADMTINVEELAQELFYERLGTSLPTVKSCRIGAFQNYHFLHYGIQTGIINVILKAKFRATVAALKKADKKQPNLLLSYCINQLMTEFSKVYGEEGVVLANESRLP